MERHAGDLAGDPESVRCCILGHVGLGHVGLGHVGLSDARERCVMWRTTTERLRTARDHIEKRIER